MILLNQFHQILTSLIVTLTVMEVVPKEVKKPEMMKLPSTRLCIQNYLK